MDQPERIEATTVSHANIKPMHTACGTLARLVRLKPPAGKRQEEYVGGLNHRTGFKDKK